MCVCTCVYVCVCTCVYTCVCVCTMHVCVRWGGRWERERGEGVGCAAMTGNFIIIFQDLSTVIYNEQMVSFIDLKANVKA